MPRCTRTLVTALVVLLATAAVAQGAIIGSPDFAVSPFTKAQVGAGNAVTATLAWLPPTFTPASANDKQQVTYQDLDGGGPTSSVISSTATTFPLILTNGHRYTFTVSACTTAASSCDPNSASTTSRSVATRIDATPPAGSVLINGGAVATNNRSVTLDLAASDPLIGGAPGTSSGVTQVATDIDGNGTTPCVVFVTPPDTSGCAEPFAPRVTAMVPAGDGLKTVGVLFGDGARVNTSPCPPNIFCATLLGSFIEGNVSDEATDTIILDTVKPTAAPTLDGTSVERGGSVAFSSAGSTDPGSGIDGAATTWDFNDGTPVVTGATATHAFTTTGTFIGRLRVRDRAGNVSDPTPFTVIVTPKPGETVSGSGSIAGVTGTAGFSVSRLKVKAKYVRSRLKGTVRISGTSTLGGRLRVVLRRGPRGAVLRAKSSRITAAPFATTLTLPPSLLPGRYALALVGPGGTLSAVLTLTPPREGVIRRGAITRPGPGALATFRFAVRPIATLRGDLTVTWSQGTRTLGVVPVGSGTVVRAALPTGATVTGGILRAVLRAGTIVIGSTSAGSR